MKKILLVGLGKISRGLIVPVFKEAGYHVTGAVTNSDKVKQIHKNYRLQTPRHTTNVMIDDIIAMERVEDTFDLIVTAVGRQNLVTVAQWYQQKQLTAPVLLAENLPDPINLFPRQIPLVIDRICPRMTTMQDDIITVVVEDYYKIVVLDDPLTHQLGIVKNVELENSEESVEQKRKQKMFTLNTTHLLTAFYGQQLGYRTVEEAIANPEIASRIRSVIHEVRPLFGFDQQQAEKKAKEIVKRFAAPLQDPLSRILTLDKLSTALRYIDVPLNELCAMNKEAPTLKEASVLLNRLSNMSSLKKKAIIFDMDGVISDTQQFHAEVESKLLDRFGIHILPEEITDQYAGIATEVWFSEVLTKNSIKVDSLPNLMFEKWELMREMAKGNLQEISGATQLIKQLKEHGFKLAIASSSTKAFINEVLTELELHPYFDATVSAQEVAQGKPAPDIFLLAAHRLHVLPEEAIVIEDGRSGMIAAMAAKMKSIGLVTDKKADYPATLLVNTLDEIRIPTIHTL